MNRPMPSELVGEIAAFAPDATTRANVSRFADPANRPRIKIKQDEIASHEEKVFTNEHINDLIRISEVIRELDELRIKKVNTEKEHVKLINRFIKRVMSPIGIKYHTKKSGDWETLENLQKIIHNMVKPYLTFPGFEPTSKLIGKRLEVDDDYRILLAITRAADNQLDFLIQERWDEAHPHEEENNLDN